MSMYVVKYRVPEMTGEQVHERGPWHRHQAEEELADIRGYMGVTDARVEPVEEEDQ